MRLFLVVLILTAMTGCSLYTSSRSVSDSSDSSESSSRSSTSKDKRSYYQDDVRRYVAASAASTHALDALEKRLGEIAQSHGITNWEEDETTFVAIGRGLHDAGVDNTRLETYTAHFSRSDSSRLQAMQHGYDARP
jgi:hypothetical protein